MDIENDEDDKKLLPLLGSKMLWGFEFKKDEYIDGKVYDARDGATYKGKMWFEDKNTLKLKGYWGIFWKTSTWSRVNSSKSWNKN